MTKLLTHAGFKIPCTEEQALTSIRAFGHFESGLSDYARLVASGNATDLPEARIIRYCIDNHPDNQSDGSYAETEWRFTPKVAEAGDGIECFDDELNTELAALFVQAVLLAFDLPHLVEIAAAHTCDDEVVALSEFGGHGVVVTREYVRYHLLSDFFRSEYIAHAASLRFYFVRIEVHSEHFSGHVDSLMQCHRGSDPQARLDEVFNSYGTRKADSAGDDCVLVWNNDHCYSNPVMKEVSAYEADLFFWISNPTVHLDPATCK